uniref:Uncharacterized protein n=1 Tax=Peronospora matthiolae TaxID=2874970 RepID=A0AAV1TDV2_9STRA
MAKKKKINTSFQPAQKLTYAVDVVSTTSDTIITCRCKICELLGRDPIVIGLSSSRKRKSHSSVQ